MIGLNKKVLLAFYATLVVSGTKDTKYTKIHEKYLEVSQLFTVKGKLLTLELFFSAQLDMGSPWARRVILPRNKNTPTVYFPKKKHYHLMHLDINNM